MVRTDHSGRILEGRYQLLKRIGEGGMGSVYLGEHAVIGKQVAVKLLREEFSSRPRIVKRFYREARAAAAIKHRNIIDIFDLGISDWGEPFLVMEYLEGESLASLLDRQTRISLAATQTIIGPVLGALDAAHDAGITHRDLKPDNIFVVHEPEGDLTIKLIDFGISKFAQNEEDTKLTMTGSLLGTPDYMSPEQAQGKQDVNHLTDIYAVGVILYEMLTGTLPFIADNYPKLLLKIIGEEPTPPRVACATFPVVAEPLIMRALSKEAGQRFSSAQHMLEAIDEWGEASNGVQQLRAYSYGAKTLGFAAGDLGDKTVTLTAPEVVAAKVLEEFINPKGTPTGWAQTLRRLGPQGRWSVAAMALLVVALAVAGVLIFTGRTVPKEIEMAERGPVAAAVEKTKPVGVWITVKGAPKGSRIYYKDALVPMNPFPVDRGQTIAALRVEADGYESFTHGIVPKVDRTVDVVLKEKQLKKPAKKAAVKAASRPPVRGPLSSAQQQIVYVKNKRQLKSCYDQALDKKTVPRDKTLAITLRFDVGRGGRANNVTLSGPGAKYPEMNRCLKDKVNAWSFPPSTVSTPVEYSFAFTPKE
jgi:tRNA A-37 threonylcarbamoyl transferase component Bud32